MDSPHRRRTAALVALAAVLERCDEQVLPAVYRYIGASWQASPTQLGYITLCRALVQALTAPVGGIAGHCLHRARVLGAGCLVWAAMTGAFAACRSLPVGAAVWAVNGFGLALVLPTTQSLTADLFPAAQRGRAFGALYLTGALGGMAGALYATNLGGLHPFGIEGWRFAFASLAAVAAAAGAAILAWAEDPLRPSKQQLGGGALPPASKAADVSSAAAVAGAPAGPEDGGSADEQAPLRSSGATAGSSAGSGAGTPSEGAAEAGGREQQGAPAAAAAGSWADLREVLGEVGSVLCIPSFLLIVAQGICGSVPWSALVFLTLYLQLLGMSDGQASLLVALFLAGTACGGLIGGCVGDAAARRFPQHGRIVVAQVSVASGIPFALLLFKGLPRGGPGAPSVPLYAAVLLAFALLKAWPAPAFNNPAFAEIVPARQRNLVYAFDRCFEGAVAACTAPLVGLLAQRLWGFSGSGTVTHDHAKDLANARALGSALTAFLAVPWALTVCLYSALHCSYPRDKAAALRRERLALRAQSRALEEPGVAIDRLSSAASLPAVAAEGGDPGLASASRSGSAIQLAASPPQGEGDAAEGARLLALVER